MSDHETALLIRSDASLVSIEAAAGCGKTHQGASFAREWATKETVRRLLILTHTHAACDEFAKRVSGVGGNVDISTIDGLIARIAAAYHLALGFPRDPARWAISQGGDGFQNLAKKVASYLELHPMIPMALVRRYPMIICDEHQDCSADQHRIVMAMYKSGASIRLFGDPMQRIYGDHSNKAIEADWARWAHLKDLGQSALLDTPHRWHQGGERELGDWVIGARRTLQNGGQIDLSEPVPQGLTIVTARNMAQKRTGYILAPGDRRRLDSTRRHCNPLLVLAPSNELVASLRAFWNRGLPIWEGHQRNALTNYVNAISEGLGNPESIGTAVIKFLQTVAVGFTMNSHGDRLMTEISENCARLVRGEKPPRIQALARLICNRPDHRGAGDALALVLEFSKTRAPGFDNVKIDYWSEFKDAIKLRAFEAPGIGFEEIGRIRTNTRRPPPSQAISSIHKSKGLECDHVMLVFSDASQLSGTLYSRNRLYVALSRARKSLTLVLPDTIDTPILRI